MKYKLLITVAIFLSVFVIRLSFINDSFDNCDFVYEKKEQYKHDVYYYDNNTLVYVTITFDEQIEISYLFDLLTNKSNTISNDYDTKLVVSTQLINIETSGNNLVINLTEEFLRYKEEECYQIYLQLKNTFSNLDFQTLFINVEDIPLMQIGYLNIENGIELSNI